MCLGQIIARTFYLSPLSLPKTRNHFNTTEVTTMADLFFCSKGLLGATLAIRTCTSMTEVCVGRAAPRLLLLLLHTHEKKLKY